jgi:hypothetical protein
MVPSGSIMHLRYETQYLAPGIVEIMRERVLGKGTSICGTEALISYVYQESVEGGSDAPLRPIKRYPFRFGTVSDAYLVGGVAHFIIESGHYPSYVASDSVEDQLTEVLGATSSQTHFAVLARRLSRTYVCRVESEYSQAFQHIVLGLDRNHLRPIGPKDKKRYYDPVFIRVSRPSLVSRSWPRESKPTDIVVFQQHEYGFEIPRNYDCILRIETYQPKWSTVPKRKCKIVVNSDPGHLSSFDEFPVSSRYDEFEAYIRPILGQNPWFGRFGVAAESENETSESEIMSATWTCWLSLQPRFAPFWLYSTDAAAALFMVFLGLSVDEYKISHDPTGLAFVAVCTAALLMIRSALGGKDKE